MNRNLVVYVTTTGPSLDETRREFEITPAATALIIFYVVIFIQHRKKLYAIKILIAAINLYLINDSIVISLPFLFSKKGKKGEGRKFIE